MKRPPEITIREIEQRFADLDLIPCPELVDGAWHFLNRPRVNLLLDGHQGSGKTEAAKALAVMRQAAFYEIDWYLETETSLFFDPDLLAATARRMGLGAVESWSEDDLYRLLETAPVGVIPRIFLNRERETLLLIDEVDKSEADGSSVRDGQSAERKDKRATLLRLLDKREIGVLGRTVRPRQPIHIVMSSNRRSRFTEEFYDRVYHTPVRVPGPGRIYEIIRKRWPRAGHELALDLANLIYRTRMEEMYVKPSIRAVASLIETAEILGKRYLDRELLERSKGILAKIDTDRSLLTHVLDDIQRHVEAHRSEYAPTLAWEGDELANRQPVEEEGMYLETYA